MKKYEAVTEKSNTFIFYSIHRANSVKNFEDAAREQRAFFGSYASNNDAIYQTYLIK